MSVQHSLKLCGNSGMPCPRSIIELYNIKFMMQNLISLDDENSFKIRWPQNTGFITIAQLCATIWIQSCSRSEARGPGPRTAVWILSSYEAIRVWNPEYGSGGSRFSTLEVTVEISASLKALDQPDSVTELNNTAIQSLTLNRIFLLT